MKNFLKLSFAFLLSFFAVEAFAVTTPIDMAVISDAVDFSKLTTALGTIFAAMASVGIFMKGGAFILRKLGWK